MADTAALRLLTEVFCFPLETLECARGCDQVDRRAGTGTERGCLVERWLALELASTIRHDGDGGVADDLATVRGTTDWIEEQRDLLTGHLPAGALVADEDLRLRIVELRQGVRALFARLVTPAPPARRTPIACCPPTRRWTASTPLPRGNRSSRGWTGPTAGSPPSGCCPRRPIRTSGSSPPWHGRPSTSWPGRRARGCAPAPRRAACVTSSRAMAGRSGASRPAGTAPARPATTGAGVRRTPPPAPVRVNQ